MKPRFMEYRRMLLRQFPGVPIVGKVYPPGDSKILVATIAQYCFFLGIAVIFFGRALERITSARSRKRSMIARRCANGSWSCSERTPCRSSCQIRCQLGSE